MSPRKVPFAERLVGIVQIFNVRVLEAEAALLALEGDDDTATEALRAYKIARNVELKCAIEAWNRKLKQLGRLLADPESVTDADVLNLDDFR